MNKFTTGMVIGGIMTAAGVGYLMTNKSASQQMVQKGKRMVHKAEHTIDDMMDKMVP